MSKSLEERLSALMKQHPALEKRIESMLEVLDAEEGVLDNANDAEERVIEELQKLGSELLDGWAENKEDQQFLRASKRDPALKTHSKKN